MSFYTKTFGISMFLILSNAGFASGDLFRAVVCKASQKNIQYRPLTMEIYFSEYGLESGTQKGVILSEVRDEYRRTAKFAQEADLTVSNHGKTVSVKTLSKSLSSLSFEVALSTKGSKTTALITDTTGNDPAGENTARVQYTCTQVLPITSEE